MTKLVGWLAGVAALAGCGLAAGDRPAGPGQVLLVRASGCRTVEELGTGFSPAPGLVVTTAHTVRGATGVTVQRPGRRAGSARVVALNHRNDVAVLAVSAVVPVTGLAERSTPGPAAVLVLRDGQAQRDDASVRRVITARVEEPIDGVRYARRALELVEADIRPGDSGAPVVNGAGLIVGMAFASSRRQEGRAYAVAAEEIVAELAGSRPESPTVPTGACP